MEGGTNGATREHIAPTCSLAFGMNSVLDP